VLPTILSTVDAKWTIRRGEVAFNRLVQRTTPDTVAEVVRKAILDGSLAPGSQLREAHIAAELGVSRAPLREALSKLEDEGLVVKVAFRGSFVAEVGPKIIEEIATLRLRLEPFAIERSLPWLRGAGRVHIKGLLADLTNAATAGDITGCIDSHLALHRVFYEAADHGLLLDLWHAWESQLRLFLAADLREFAHPIEVAAGHEDLCQVISNGDLVTITHAVNRHIHAAHTSIAPKGDAAGAPVPRREQRLQVASEMPALPQL
jgi:DNA-binding GntR family transcriptional regulator